MHLLKRRAAWETVFEPIFELQVGPVLGLDAWESN
jgi:hypothetical protein